jgi:hypothetical protein
VEEIAPGIIRIDDYDFDNSKVDGKERSVTYAGSGLPNIEGPVSVVKELQSCPEFKERALAIAIIDSEANSLEKVFWFQGKHIFPKEYLELAINNKEIVILFTNHGISDKAVIENAVNLMLPESGSSYTLLDLLWVEGDMLGSYMCTGIGLCCPVGGIDLTTIHSHIDGTP